MGAAQALPHRVNRLTGTDATAGKGREGELEHYNATSELGAPKRSWFHLCAFISVM